MKEKILVMITAGSQEEGAKIAEALLEGHLIACANLIGGIRSLFRWKGEICDERETLILCKTERRLFPRLSETVKSIHSYEVPEIIALSLVEGWGPYLEWVEQQTSQG
jgi:periplasmic divalent cation tolerance protein